MVLSGIVILITLGLAYIWGSRGFFSSLLHMVCVLIAGAIAFALWEPISYAILKGTTSQFLIDIAWGVGLGFPFALSLVVLRVACDKLVPANCDLDGMPNLLGGAVCGIVTGTITAGIFVISISFLRIPPEAGMFKPVDQEANGSPKIVHHLIYPADSLTAWVYGYASEATLRSSTPLDKWRPTLPVDGALLRTNFNDGGSRHTLTPKSYSISRRFTVGKKAVGSLKVEDLLSDGFSPGKPRVSTIDGSDISASDKNYYIEGIVLNFNSLAREKEGNVVIGNTQIQLVCRNADDTQSISIHPVAMSSKAEPTNADDKRIRYGRWRYERPNTYIRSVGGTDQALMGFEFLVPKDYTPIALYVKGVREDLTRVEDAQTDYSDNKARDKAIQDGSALGGEKGVASTPLVYGKEGKQGPVLINPDEGSELEKPIRIADGLPPNKNVTMILSKDNIGDMKVNDERQMVSGEAKYRISDLQKNRGIDGKLQVRQFFTGEDTVMVQVNFGKDSPLAGVRNAVANTATGAPVLVDVRGESYPCVGFIYYDNQLVHLRYTPESIIRQISDLPNGGPSSSRPDQSFYLLFRVGKNTKLNMMKIGETPIAEIKPDMLIKK